MGKKLSEKHLRKIISESVKRALNEMEDGLEDVMIYHLIANLGLSEEDKHDLLSATLYDKNDNPVGKLNDLHVKYDARNGRNGGFVGSFWLQ